MQVVGQETQTVQKDALFTKGAAEPRVDLVDDEHAYLQLPSQYAHALTQIGRTQPHRYYRFHSHQQFLVEIALVRSGRHLQSHHRQSGSTAYFVKVRVVFPEKSLNDASLAHTGCPK